MVGVIVLALIASLLRASRIHVLAPRRERGQARLGRLWRRLYLDLVATIIALTAYAVALYLADIGGLLDTHAQALVSAPVALIAPVFLRLAAVLLFFRSSPLLLRLASWLL